MYIPKGSNPILGELHSSVWVNLTQLCPQAVLKGWYYNAIPGLRSQDIAIRIRKVLKCDPKSTKMRSEKY